MADILSFEMTIKTLESQWSQIPDVTGARRMLDRVNKYDQELGDEPGVGKEILEWWRLRLQRLLDTVVPETPNPFTCKTGPILKVTIERKE